LRRSAAIASVNEESMGNTDADVDRQEDREI
jgi:hypothetical protein